MYWHQQPFPCTKSCVLALKAVSWLHLITALCSLQDEGGALQAEAAGRQVAHELLVRLGSSADVPAAARASVRAVGPASTDGLEGTAVGPVFAVGCVAIAEGGEVVGHVDDELVARNFRGERICSMAEVCMCCIALRYRPGTLG